MANSPPLYIGLMSGTSTDGVDGVLAAFPRHGHPEILADISIPLPSSLRHELLLLNQSGPDELVRASLAANALAIEYAKACNGLLQQSHLQPSDIRAIGAHGQTVRHNPASGYTIQLNAPALLAELTRINVVADFRTRDVAAGGQGAPLVPAFHAAVFCTGFTRTVLNLGGIANVTLLSPGDPVRGFDTGPANVLLDLWCELHTGAPYDKDGQWSATGEACLSLLDYLIDSEPWFTLPPPKSTGRDLFNRNWLENRLEAWFKNHPHQHLTPQDIQATLIDLTARTVADALMSTGKTSEDILVCGGGAMNSHLLQAIADRTGIPVHTTDEFGIPAQLVEALAFAWLAWAYENNHPSGLPSVTGARQANILGGLYKA